MFREEPPESALPSTHPRTSLSVSPVSRLPSDPDAQHSLLEASLVQSQDSMLLVESDLPDLAGFRLLYANPAFVNSGLGKAVSGLELRECLSVFAEAFAVPSLTAHVKAVLASGLSVRGEPLTGLQDGQPRRVLMDIVPLKPLSKTRSQWLLILRDVTVQDQVETALQQTQERYRLLTDFMADVVSLHDPNGRFLYVTPSIFRLTGFTVEESLECDPRTIVHPDDLDRMFIPGLAWESQDTNSFRLEWRRLRKDGSYLWLETTATCVYDEKGQIYRVVCCSRDISRRKQTENVLHEEQALLRTLIDCLPDSIYMKDSHGRFLLNNGAHRRFLNREASDILGKTSWDLWPSELATLYEADDRVVIRSGQILRNREEPIQDAEGNRRWVSTTKTPLTGPDGTVVGLIGISRDITERREAAEALKQIAEKYQLLFQANPQPMWVYDADTLAFLAVNDTAVERYGYSREEFLHMSIAEIHPAEDMTALMQVLTLPGNSTQVTGPWQQLRKDGSKIWVEVHSHVLRFNEREARLVVANNVTERKEMEAVTEKLLLQTKRLLAEAVERADRDPLTGLLNHRAFHKRFEMEANAAQLTASTVAIAMMDLDNFKFFNDAYGHSVGDDVLKQVTAALLATCRPEDTLGRFGGDEFALLMPGMDVEAAVRQADRLVAALNGVGYCPPGYKSIIPLTLSIGIAVYPDDGPGRLEALAAADTRLVRVKNGGSGMGELTEHLRAHLSCKPEDFAMLNALVTAVDNKDRYTRRHSEDVMAYSFQIAHELGLEERVRNQILLAALLHDVGKIGVPDRVLRKPGVLTAEEFDALKQHPIMGAVIVGAVPGFEETLDGVRHHHEHWDGNGYPHGLQGNQIPLMARVMAVADAFSAMTTDRPYRKGMSKDIALAILEAGSGSQWDPECVGVFVAARHRASSWTDG